VAIDQDHMDETPHDKAPLDLVSLRKPAKK
jgi:hypothetical protein